MIRATLAEQFLFGDDVVLLAMDGEGATALRDALRAAVRQGSSREDLDEVAHSFVIDTGEAGVELSEGRVVWRLDRAKAEEMIDFLDALHRSDQPGHFYVDISDPVDTLVLSRDEY